MTKKPKPAKKRRKEKQSVNTGTKSQVFQDDSMNGSTFPEQEQRYDRCIQTIPYRSEDYPAKDKEHCYCNGNLIRIAIDREHYYRCGDCGNDYSMTLEFTDTRMERMIRNERHSDDT